MLRSLLVLMFLIMASAPAFADPVAVPDSYATCKKDAAYTEKTEQKCVFEVPIDKSNSQRTVDYFACQKSKPNWQFLHSFSCDYADYDDKSRPKFARCLRDKVPSVFPPFHDDCRLVFYNPDFAYPTSLETCMKKEDRKEDVTNELKQICSIKISFVPETSGEVFKKTEATKMIEKCQDAGGEAEMVDFYPRCTLTFTQK